MALSLVVEAVARLRRVEAPKLPGLGRPQAARPRPHRAGGPALRRRAPHRAGHHAASAAAPAHAAVGHHVRRRHRPRRARPSSAATDVTRQDAKRQKTISHTVKPGESLWAIADQHLGDGSRYKEIAELNRDLLGARPSFLEPGWVLKLPRAGAERHPGPRRTP